MMDKVKCTKDPPQCQRYRNGTCTAFKKCKYQSSFTNADRIRAMNDEELADFLNQWGTSTRAWQKDPGETLYWLQQTAGEEGKHETDRR